jgi:sec-independent protein translocase protein TatA
MSPLFAVLGLGMPEMIMIGIVGVILFGRRLPEVGRYLGKGIVEFKKGMKGVEDDLNVPSNDYAAPAEPPRPPQRVGSAAPKFEDTPMPTDSEGKPRT